jgi:putative transposase
VNDDFNQEALTVVINLSQSDEQVVRSLDQVIEWRGKPQAILSNNGPQGFGSTLTNRVNNMRE